MNCEMKKVMIDDWGWMGWSKEAQENSDTERTLLFGMKYGR